ncbi:alpha-L-rhamnosidase [Enterococcus casseliflavus]|uniref:alpha-L-rhamnosidase n=1 Tax=Enterococcus casseliflavus TaxID=37734 RepID=UPI0035E02841
MEINQMTINYYTEPLGYDLSDPVFRYQVTDQSKAVFHALEVALDADFQAIVSQVPKQKLAAYRFSCTFPMQPRQRYFWRVTIWDAAGDRYQKTSWFETGKLQEAWQGKWITPVTTPLESAIFSYQGDFAKPIKQARLYICGLGLYEAYLNEQKIGDEFFTPGYTNYHEWLQYQTYDVTDDLVDSQYTIKVLVGKGWYQGNFGFHGGKENIYGDAFLLRAELHLEYVDGTQEIHGTNQEWQVRTGSIGKNSIYYGEDIDETIPHLPIQAVKEHQGPQGKLTERFSLPVKIKEERPAIACWQEEGDWVLDFGQNMVGWVTFYDQLPPGAQIKLEHAELLVNGKFYRENLRAARAAFTYRSNGNRQWVRPHFSFFGFRYVRISGWPLECPFAKVAFIGQVIYSDLETTGDFRTSNEKVNQLYQNILWSQKGNFFDVPMDCPQRDERMGWTGDAQLFSQTAMYTMDTYAFFRKYLHDLASEQPHFDGAPPMTVPHVPTDIQQSGAAVGVWGDAATIIPWHLYRYYGEPQILKQQFSSMQAWVEHIGRKTHINGLWDKQFQFGDWLALDGDDPASPIGGTEAKFVANIFYWHSLKIVAQAAAILGYTSETKKYDQRQRMLKQALRAEYFTPNGRLALDTQTAYVLTLAFDLAADHEVAGIVQKLKERLKRDDYHLKTGFVGTPFLNLVLSNYGLNEIAYTLLLNNDYPSWLYAIDLGATTIWERWNSLLPDGSINPQGMNSFNHYAYGAIGQWFFEGVLGIQQASSSSGFRHVHIQPQIHWSINHASGGIATPNGRIEVAWAYVAKDIVKLDVTLPTLTQAILHLPEVEIYTDEALTDRWSEETPLKAGQNHFYLKATAYQKPIISAETTLGEIQQTPLMYVRAKQRFAESKLFSSSNVRDHQKRSLAYFVNQEVISETQLAGFIDEMTALIKGDKN